MPQSFLTMRGSPRASVLGAVWTERAKWGGDLFNEAEVEGGRTLAFPVCCLLSLSALMAWENRFLVLLCSFPPLSDVAFSALSHSGHAVFGFVLDH